MSLNQAQRNAVTTTLVQLDQALDEIERLLDGPTSGITYATEIDFGLATARRIRERCTDIRSQSADIVAAFELPRQQRNGRQIIVAEMSLAWVNLEEVRPHRLRRYGAVAPTLAETLEPGLEYLASLALTIQDLASRGD